MNILAILNKRIAYPGQELPRMLLLNEQLLMLSLVRTGTGCDIMPENYLKEDIITTDDVSVLVGYQNTVSFMRAFKQWTGMTVTEYKTRVK